MNFSAKYGFKSLRNELQIDSMDSALRNSLWNAIYYILNDSIIYIEETVICDFFKQPLEIRDSILDSYDDSDGLKRIQEIQQKFNKLQWYEVYDFIEFIVDLEVLNKASKYVNFKSLLKELKANVNKYLERELSAYILIGNQIIRITNENEISSIEQSLSIKEKKFEILEKHFSTSLSLLSNRINPNYRNSIKESISAVEACCRILTEESTLGKAIDKLEKSGITIDSQLKNGFAKIYDYTNSKSSGIRHALMENGKEPDFNDAKFMLVSCSAFTNYLISKSIIK
jgi:AbiJ N-terminal domain 4